MLVVVIDEGEVRMRGRGAAAALVALVALGAMTLGAGPAGAELNGPCTAHRTFTPGGLDVDPAAGNVFEIPRKGSVDWFGQVGSGDPEAMTDPRAYSGAVSVEGPPLFGDLFGSLLELDPWGGTEGTRVSKSGVREYDLGSLIPGGSEVIVSGFHNDALGDCDGFVVLSVDDSDLGPLGTAALGGTAISLLLFLYSLVPKP